MMKNKHGELESSTREQYKMTGESPLECLPEMFEAVFARQLQPAFQKMLDEKTFKALRAFAHWNSGFNQFRLEILGGILPEPVELVFHDGMPPQTCENFEKNLREMNAMLLEMMIKEMSRQNIIGGAGREFSVQVHVGVLDFSYIFTITWQCVPQKQSFAAGRGKYSRNAQNN